MSLTPEQFNKLFTKEDFKKEKEDLISKSYFDYRMNSLMDVIDKLY